jgi:hypothetical protein
LAVVVAYSNELCSDTRIYGIGLNMGSFNKENGGKELKTRRNAQSKTREGRTGLGHDYGIVV